MIQEHLLYGRENAQTGRELAEILHCSRREISEMVRRARLAGVPIISSCSPDCCGYYLATTPEEVEILCKSLFRRAREAFRTRDALKKAAQEMRTGEERAG